NLVVDVRGEDGERRRGNPLRPVAGAAGHFEDPVIDKEFTQQTSHDGQVTLPFGLVVDGFVFGSALRVVKTKTILLLRRPNPVSVDVRGSSGVHQVGGRDGPTGDCRLSGAASGVAINSRACASA